ncbi:MAG: type I 3-dehydroquinate dehydratase [Candidatus Helarchaeota archaeon]
MNNNKKICGELFKTICIAIAAKNLEEAIKKIKKSTSIGADLIEIRLDYFDIINPNELSKILKKTRIPLIFTLRKKDEGGYFNSSEDKRIDLLKKIIRIRPQYVDIELSSQEINELLNFAKTHKVRTIISYHNFKTTPNINELNKLLLKIEELDGNVSKIITTATDLEDNLIILNLIRSAKKKIVAFAMGENGIFSRVFSPIFGAFFTFASLDKKTAPGQINIKDMRYLQKKFLKIKQDLP